LFYNTDNDKNDEKEAIKLLRSKQIDGIILSLSLENKDILNVLHPVKKIISKVWNEYKFFGIFGGGSSPKGLNL